MISAELTKRYAFGEFQVDPDTRTLSCKGEPIHLTERAFDVLILLLQERGKVVTKDQLLRNIWQDSFVEEGNIPVTISMIRKAIGEGKDGRLYIKTIPKRGYRFDGDVKEAEDFLSDLPVFVEPRRSSFANAPRTRKLFISWLVIGIVVLVCFAAGLSLYHLNATLGNAPRVFSIAVLPFQSFESDNREGHIGVELANGIISRMASDRQIRVRPISNPVRNSDPQTIPLEIARAQKVDATLSGYVEVPGDEVRVTLQLVRISDGSLIWADSYEAPSQQVSILEDGISRRVVRSVSTMTSPNEQVHPVKLVTENPHARELYLQGKYLANKRDVSSVERSIDYFSGAIKEDPVYAPAYVSVGESYMLLNCYGQLAPWDTYWRAKDAALKAVQTDPSLASAHTLLGMLHFYFDSDSLEAEKEFRQAVVLNPDDSAAHARLAVFLALLGNKIDAVREANRAQKLDPTSLMANASLGWVLYFNRDYDGAIDAYRRSLSLEPQFWRAHTRLGLAYAAKKDFPQAMSEFQMAQKFGSHERFLLGGLGYVEASAGNTKAALQLLGRLTHEQQYKYVSPYNVALIYIGLGNKDRALEWLDKTYQDRWQDMVYAKTDPLLDPLRSDPRFMALLHKLETP